MAIFNSYVELPDGMYWDLNDGFQWITGESMAGSCVTKEFAKPPGLLVFYRVLPFLMVFYKLLRATPCIPRGGSQLLYFSSVEEKRGERTAV